MDVAAALAPRGRALSSGDYGGVGVGGLAAVVLADGTVSTARPDESPALFWAIRGVGANFGIVTSFVFEGDEIGDIGFAHLAFGASDTAGF